MILDRGRSESSTELVDQKGKETSARTSQQSSSDTSSNSRGHLKHHISDLSTSNLTASAVVCRLDMLKPLSEYNGIGNAPKTPTPRSKARASPELITPTRKLQERGPRTPKPSVSPQRVRSPSRSMSPSRVIGTSVQSPRISRSQEHRRPTSPTKRGSASSARKRSPSPLLSFERNKGRTASPSRGTSPLRMFPKVPSTPVKQSSKLLMSPSSTPKRQRPKTTTKTTLPSQPPLTPPQTYSPRRHHRTSPRRRRSSSNSRQSDINFDLSELYHSSLPALPAGSIMAGDHSVDDSFPPRMSQLLPPLLQTPDVPEPDSTEPESKEPVKTVTEAGADAATATATTTKQQESCRREPPRTRGILRSISLTMGLRGKQKSSSSASVGGGRHMASSNNNRISKKDPSDSQVPSTRRASLEYLTEKHELPNISKKTSSDSSTVAAPERKSKGRTRGFLSRNSSLPSDPTTRPKLQLPDASPAKGRRQRNKSCASVPTTTTSVVTEKDSTKAFERTSIVLDIQRILTGESDENSDGYRIVHLITDLETKMSVWDAVRDAHQSYPENRIFKVDQNLEQALKDGEKRGLLSIEGSGEDMRGFNIKQSFDYWKRKDLLGTVLALVPPSKQYLSIRVEYEDVFEAQSNEKDMFDCF